MAGGETSAANEPEWRRLNRANWDERAAIHLGPRGYDLMHLRGGRGRLPIVEAELGPVAGLRVLHLQCHIGTDSLALAQRGAEVVGLDFSAAAITAARDLAGELGLADRARFVLADVYDAPRAIAEPAAFDRVFVSWGTICWLPDVRAWANIVAHFLKPGGCFYFAEGHPAALVFDDRSGTPGGRPGFGLPYFASQPLIEADPRDYSDAEARLVNATTHQWLHPLADVVTAVIQAGLRLDWLHEHDAVMWRMFDCLVEGSDGVFRWPDKPWLPLAYSLHATRGD
ncbi:MAG TPA: methyltransferase domain-containing protein [Acetobacteraceae bacterium]